MNLFLICKNIDINKARIGPFDPEKSITGIALGSGIKIMRLKPKNKAMQRSASHKSLDSQIGLTLPTINLSLIENPIPS